MADQDDFAAAVGALIKGRLAMPKATLTTENLNDVTAPGFHMQQNNADATLGRNYPWAGISCDILVMPLNPAWNTFTQVAFPNNAFAVGLATRSLRNGVWSDWAPFDTRSTADRRYAPISVADQVANIPRLGTPGALKVAPLALTTGWSGRNAPTVRAYRVPIRFTAPIGRWRLHIRNWNPRLGTVTAAPVDFTGLWIADHAGSGGIAGTPVQVQDAFATPADGSEWVSDWHDTPIGEGVERLLCFGYTTATAPQDMIGGGWNIADPASAADATATPIPNAYTPFDLWIEAETPATTPIIAGVGDSLTSGTGATIPVHESWVSQYARRVGGLPLHMSHHGDSMYGFLSVNPGKVTRWDHLARADAVVWALGSNDIGDGRTLAQMQADYATLLPTVEAAVGPVAYAATVQPRNSWDAATETARSAWNAWLTSRPGVRGVLDFASVVSADGDTLRPEYDSGDGAHLNTAGYAAEAASITTPLTAPPAVTGDRVGAIEDRLAAALYDSGLRDITSLASGVVSGSVQFRVRNGWAQLSFGDTQFSTASPEAFASGGHLAPWAPSSPGAGRGQVTEVSGTNTTRVSVAHNGNVRLLGAPANRPLNGSVIWPFDRTPPASPIGDPA